MKKHVLKTAIAALLVLSGLPSAIFAAEDLAALTDRRIAALKSGLQLNSTQEKKWFVLELVLREEIKIRAARAAESRDQAEGLHEHRDVIERLRERAKLLEASSVELQTIAAEFKKLADAAEPLYESLDDAQKRRFEPLLRKHVGLPDLRLMEYDRAAQRPQ